MSLFPQGLWAPSPKDQRADFNPIQHALLTGATGASTAVAAMTANTIPADKVLLVSHLVATGVPGAAQFVTRIIVRWGFQDPAGAFQAIGDIKNTGTIVGAANAQVSLDWQPGQPGFPLLSGQVFEVLGSFNAAVAANVVSLSAAGVLIPRGNWQRT